MASTACCAATGAAAARHQALVQRDPTPYGTTVQLGAIACDVEQTGVRCTNQDGHGFTLSRAAFSPF